MSRHTSCSRSLLRPVLFLALAACGLLATSCGGMSASAPVAPKWDSKSVATSLSSVPFTPVIINSNLGKGPSRVALALLKRDQTLILEGTVTARIFRIDNEPEKHPDAGTLLGSYEMTARTVDIADEHQNGRTMHLDSDANGRVLVKVALRDPSHEAPAAPRHEGSLTTVFTTNVDFNEAGLWGAQLQVKTGNKTYRNLLITFAVLERTSEPSIGDQAPRTKQKLAKDVANLSEIDSSRTTRPEFHNIAVADAIASGKPSLVAFVTPAFCQTRFCGPVMETVVVPAYQQYKDRVHVIHIEPVDLAQAQKGTLVAGREFDEWKLRSEPFIFVVNGQGVVTAKFEGIIDLAEVKQALDAALAGK